MTRPRPPRDDLRALEGYHSPQVDVAVRLNTNESPYPPPAAFVDALARRAARRVDWQPLPRPRRHASCARRSARYLGSAGRAAVLRQRLQRGAADAAAHLRRPRPHAPRVRADLRAARHIARITGTEVVVGERGADFSLDPDDAPRPDRPSTRPRSCSCAARTTRPARSSRATTVERAARRRATGLVVVDEAYGEFAPWSALELVDDDRPLVVMRTYSKMWSLAGAPARLPGRRRRGWSPSSRRWCCRTTSTSATQVAGRLALELRRRDGRARRARWSRSASGVAARARRARRLDRVPVGRQLPAVPRRAATAHDVWQRAARPRRAGPRLLVVAPARRLPAGHRRHARRERRVPRRARARSCQEVVDR